MIIAINGPAGSGKDTFGRLFEADGYTIKKFAGKLKLFCSSLTGLPVSVFEEEKEHFIPLYNCTVRQMLQRVGTEVMRNNFDEDVWVKALFADYTPDQRWVITDMRFPNEMEAVLHFCSSATLVRIDLLEGPSEMTHISEHAFANIDDIWDIRFTNTKTGFAELQIPYMRVKQRVSARLLRDVGR